MTTRTRMNVYFDPALLKQVEALALRRNISKSAIVEAVVASFLSGDTTEKLEAAMSRRLDRLGRQVDALDEDLAVLGETLALFVRFWLTFAPPMSETAQAASRAKGTERFEGFMQTLGKRLATGDRFLFLKELSPDLPATAMDDAAASGIAADDSLNNPTR